MKTMNTSKRDDLQEFAELVARMTIESETEGGFCTEDAFSTLDELIYHARQITGIDPQYPQVYGGDES